MELKPAGGKIKDGTGIFFLSVHVTMPEMCLYLKKVLADGAPTTRETKKERNKERDKEKTKSFNTLFS